MPRMLSTFPPTRRIQSRASSTCFPRSTLVANRFRGSCVPARVSGAFNGAVVSRIAVAIIGAGPYGLSLAAHLSARKVRHRVFGRPMQFWSALAVAGGERYLKSYCFGTNISTPAPGYSFADYSRPRGLETFEPCSIKDFANYGRWFQQENVPWVEPVDVVHLDRQGDGFAITLADGECFMADRVVIATGLAGFAFVPPEIASLSPALATHTSQIASFVAFKGQEIAVIGAGQSALEAAALLYEAGARPHLLVRENSILWQTRVPLQRSLWRRLRSPISGLGTGPKAWALTRFPGLLHLAPAKWRTRFVKNHLPAEGAWWLRARVENKIPVQFGATVTDASEVAGRVALRLRLADNDERSLVVDHVISGSGYDIDVERLDFIGPRLRCAIERLERAPKLNNSFESSVAGLYFIGPASAMSFGPLFRFVVGAEYAVRAVAARLADRIASVK
jgi:Pyridine nucleotide-disulphide oxidoreductase